MIKNVQFTSNPIKQSKQAAIIAEDALESFKASRQQINSDSFVNHFNTAAKQATPMEKSVAIVNEPIVSANFEPHTVHKTMIERVKSFAASLGNPAEDIEKGGMDYLA